MATSLESRSLLVVTAVAAGVHAGIAPEHLREWPPLGGAFVAAAVALAAASVALSLVPAARGTAVAVGALLAAVAGAYVLTRLTAVPLLDPEREQLDALGAATTAAEAVGVLLALRLARPTTSPQEVTG
jgi:hypothetical protein